MNIDLNYSISLIPGKKTNISPFIVSIVNIILKVCMAATSINYLTSKLTGTFGKFIILF